MDDDGGLSSAGPVSMFVTVHSQMSRPSYERPIDSRARSDGNAATHASSVSVNSAYV